MENHILKSINNNHKSINGLKEIIILLIERIKELEKITKRNYPH